MKNFKELKKENFDKEHYVNFLETQLREQDNELLPNEYMICKARKYSSYGSFLDTVIISMPSILGESLQDIQNVDMTEFDGDSDSDINHFIFYKMDDCNIYMGVYELYDELHLHFVFNGDEAEREKYFNDILDFFNNAFEETQNYQA